MRSQKHFVHEEMAEANVRSLNAAEIGVENITGSSSREAELKSATELRIPSGNREVDSKFCKVNKPVLMQYG